MLSNDREGSSLFFVESELFDNRLNCSLHLRSACNEYHWPPVALRCSHSLSELYHLLLCYLNRVFHFFDGNRAMMKYVGCRCCFGSFRRKVTGVQVCIHCFMHIPVTFSC